jgi:hypothetical protein
MSADNRVCIMTDRWGMWHVWHGSMSTNYCEPSESWITRRIFETREQALAAAYKLEEEIGYLEGGISEIGPDEIRAGLLETLQDVASRLRLLQETGQQFQIRDEA